MRRLGPTLLALAALGAATSGPAQAAPADDCPPRKGTLARAPLGVVWHQGTTLYACTVVAATPPRARRLGRWAPQTRVAWDGVTAVWTTPLTRDGVRSDRVWAADVQSGIRWLTGRRLLPATATGPSREARIQRVLVAAESAGWVTRTGEVVLALRAPQDEPVAVGLPAAREARDDLTLLGAWPPSGPDAKTLADTAKLAVGDGEGDECGGSNPYTMTVAPDPAAPPVGVRWTGAWNRSDC